MNNPKDGGPAFPQRAHNWHDENNQLCVTFGSRGMSLRDYFAGQALVGILSRGLHPSGGGHDHRAREAYSYADAMLTAREAKNHE